MSSPSPFWFNLFHVGAVVVAAAAAAVVRQDFGRQAGQVLYSDVFFRQGRRWGKQLRHLER